MYLTFYLAKRQELPTFTGNIYFFSPRKNCENLLTLDVVKWRKTLKQIDGDKRPKIHQYDFLLAPYRIFYTVKSTISPHIL